MKKSCFCIQKVKGHYGLVIIQHHNSGTEEIETIFYIWSDNKLWAVKFIVQFKNVQIT